MKSTTKKNLIAIFGTATPGHHSRKCKLIGVNSRPILGELVIYESNLTDLWVWTANPRRKTQDVVKRIDLGSSSAIEQLQQCGAFF